MSKLFLSIAVRILLLLQMTNGFIQNINKLAPCSIVLQQRRSQILNNNIRLEPLFVTSSTPSSSSLPIHDIQSSPVSSLEDVYWDVDFDDMFPRLEQYQHLHPNEPMVPKKQEKLSAWVMGLRRLGPDRVRPEHALRLAYIGFQWKLPRSKFMERYREIRKNVKLHGQAYMMLLEIQDWISEQRVDRRQYKMNDVRYQYMVDLLGENWMKE